MSGRSIRGTGILILASCVMLVASAFLGGQPANAQSYNLVWSDEFNGAVGSGPDGSKWNYDLGGGGWGNNEKEEYTNSRNNSFITNDSAATDGKALVIRAVKENLGHSCWYGTCQYTSARLLTSGKYTVQYGRIEARAKMPIGQGLWPAFWMLGSDIGTVNWPQSGEIDIMEAIGSNMGTNHGSIHGPGYSGGSPRTATYTLPGGAKFSDAYHTFRIDWSQDQIQWFVDGNLYETRTPADVQGFQWVFNHPFFMIMNLAVGGNWPGEPNASTVFPAELRFDYVRVYQLSNPTFQPPTTTPNINPAAWYRVINQGNGKCVDDTDGGTANGTLVQQWACTANNFNQQWQFRPTSGGYYQVVNRHASGVVWDVKEVSLADNAAVHLWAYVGGNNQQWLPVSMGGGFYKFVNRNSGKCLDVPAAAAGDGVKLVQYTCNGTGAQSFSLQQQ